MAIDWQQQATMLCSAPAKINLFLHILGQRDDGYHLLQTGFQFLDFADTLGFRLRKDQQIILHTTLLGVAPTDNLIYRAAFALQQQTDTPHGVDIWLDKRIPMGAGLGGGSSNAATTLCALNKLWRLQLSTKELMQIGVTLGADVSAFILGHSAWGEGIGEQLVPILLPTPYYLVLVPDCFISTREIYSSPQLTRDTPPSKICSLLQLNDDGRYYQFFGRNDCESLVRKQYPAVDNAMNALALITTPRLTGTGSCVYAAFSNKIDAKQALSMLQERFKGFIARGLNESPLRSECM